ncbi:unnamed protein product [Closterium sp. Yama58-4]|nr:unnamed protein product [Closterium sp. Yama58-4]
MNLLAVKKEFGINGKRIKHRSWMRKAADIVVMSDTRIKEDHNFWTQLKATACATASTDKGAGGVAIVSFWRHIRFKDVTAHPTGRLLGVTVEGGETEFRLVAAYLPAQPGSRTKFHTEHLLPFTKAPEQAAASHLVLVGDFNITADPDLDRSTGAGSNKENQRLLDAWPGHDLKDAFRVLNPELREFTFHARPSGTKTRIDRALVSTSLLGQLTAAEHVRVPPKLSDHRFAIHVSLKIGSEQRCGSGIWRFQATRANRRGVREVIKRIMGGPTGRSRTLESNLPRLSAALRAHEKEEWKRTTATKKHLVAEVTRLNHLVMAGPTDASTKERLLAKEAQLEGYEESERERMQVLAGMDLELHSEIPSPYLSAKVKIRKERTLIKEVVHKGERFYGSQEVLKAAAAHFKEAFSEQTGTWQQENGAVEVAKRLPEEATNRLGAPWTAEEVKEALVGLPRGKSPRRDGLPPELFKEHWNLLGAPLVDFAKRFEESANLEESITTAVTVLLHKKGPKDHLGNYRPITLLNTVYKVQAKLLANRLKKELHLVISEGQHGFIPGRCLADAVSVVADAVEAAGNGGKDWYLLMVDFQKAYDTIARPYLFETLRKLGAPEQFVKWTEGLHRGSGTTIAINGWIGDQVEMQRGVRQGCPLAPYLFLCALEPLCLEIRRKGLGVKPEGGEELTYVGYADDTTLILKGEDQLRSAAEVLERFGDLSGLRTNKGKSVVIPLGRNRGKQSAEGVDFKWAEDGVPERLLGIWISADGDGGPSWEKAWERGKGELVKWESHHLLTAARVTVINAYIMPIFIFQVQVYPPPEELWKRIQKTCDNYVSSGQATADKLFVLWSGELARLPKKDGGLGLVDPKARVDSMAIRMVAKMLAEGGSTKRWLAEKAAALPQGEATFFADPSAAKHWPGGSQRWKAAVEAFWESPYADVPGPGNTWEASQEKLCFNRRVMFRGKSPYGNQQGTEKIHTAKLEDLIEEGPGGERRIKSKETLTTELGSVAAARWALMAYAATPNEWKVLLAASKTVTKVVEGAKTVRTYLPRTEDYLYWEVNGVTDGKVAVTSLRETEGARLQKRERPITALFRVTSVEPVVTKGGRVLGVMGAPVTKLRHGTASNRRAAEVTAALGPIEHSSLVGGRTVRRRWNTVGVSSNDAGGNDFPPHLAGEVRHGVERGGVSAEEGGEGGNPGFCTTCTNLSHGDDAQGTEEGYSKAGEGPVAGSGRG